MYIYIIQYESQAHCFINMLEVMLYTPYYYKLISFMLWFPVTITELTGHIYGKK